MRYPALPTAYFISCRLPTLYTSKIPPPSDQLFVVVENQKGSKRLDFVWLLKHLSLEFALHSYTTIVKRPPPPPLYISRNNSAFTIIVGLVSINWLKFRRTSSVIQKLHCFF